MADVTFSGTVSAQAAPGELVTLEVSTDGTVIDTLTALTLADKTFSVTKQYNAGSYIVQVHVDSDGVYASADSIIVSFTVALSSRTITVSVAVA